MSADGSTSPLVLPPITANQRDRVFLQSLTSFIHAELSAAGLASPEQRYIVYRAAFDKVIDHVNAYRPLLTAVKAEYEECIDTIIRGKQEAEYLNSKLKVIASEASTVRNYKKRCDELVDRLNIVRGNNEILFDELTQLRACRQPVLTDTDSESEGSGPTSDKQIPDSRLIPGLSLEESTDPDLLEQKLSQLQRTLRELQVSRHIQYKPKVEREKQKQKLEEKERLKERFVKREADLKSRQRKLKVAYDAARLYNKLAGPYTQESIGDVVLEALRRYKRGESLDGVEETLRRGSTMRDPSSLFDEEEPSKEKDADAVMDYIHKFNELFGDQKYSAAAVHAANSPKGVLRTMTTLHKFKAAAPAHVGDPAPLLQFVCCIMASVRAVNAKPDSEMALECVQCALHNNKLDLLQHWVGHQLLTATEELGDVLSAHCECLETCVCGCQAMAQCMYGQIECGVKTVQCMLKQGRIRQAYLYGKTHDLLDKDTCRHLLVNYGTPELVRLFVLPVGGDSVPVGVACLALIDKGYEREGLNLLEDVIREEGGVDIINEEITRGDLSEEEWRTIGRKAGIGGHLDLSLHLMAAIAVRSAVSTAANLLNCSL